MSRLDAVAYVTGLMTTTLAKAGIDPADAGLDSVVDDTLLLMGVAYTDLPTTVVADAQVVAYRAVLAYVALEKVYDAVLTFVDYTKSLGTPGVSKGERLSQMVAQVAARLVTARDKAAAFVTVSDENSWQAPGRLGLDTFNKPYYGDFGNIHAPGIGWE